MTQQSPVWSEEARAAVRETLIHCGQRGAARCSGHVAGRRDTQDHEQGQRARHLSRCRQHRPSRRYRVAALRPRAAKVTPRRGRSAVRRIRAGVAHSEAGALSRFMTISEPFLHGTRPSPAAGGLVNDGVRRYGRRSGSRTSTATGKACALPDMAKRAGRRWSRMRVRSRCNWSRISS